MIIRLKLDFLNKKTVHARQTNRIWSAAVNYLTSGCLISLGVSTGCFFLIERQYSVVSYKQYMSQHLAAQVGHRQTGKNINHAYSVYIPG